MIAWTSRLLPKPTMRESHCLTHKMLVNHRTILQVQILRSNREHMQRCSCCVLAERLLRGHEAKSSLGFVDFEVCVDAPSQSASELCAFRAFLSMNHLG